MHMGLVLAAAGLVMAASVDTGDLLNTAAQDAVRMVQESLDAAPRIGPDIKRIGVATLDGDTVRVTPLLRSSLTESRFDVVLTQDGDWAPLLDEFARQVKREDIMVKDTAHELRVQGVDAVLFGTVEKARAERVREGSQGGQRATVRLMVTLASLDEGNPGSILWSRQVTGTAEDLGPLTGFDWVVALGQDYPAPVVLLGALLALFVLASLFRQATRPR